jgi:hypothetical protein
MMTAHHHFTGAKISGNYDLEHVGEPGPAAKCFRELAGFARQIIYINRADKHLPLQTAKRFNDYSTNLLFDC